ncbi:hypothetical protein [Polaribacter sp.]|jgi:hypothetical protein|uniref:hypothetical protein n=1 Tax=Polaribacter sp. TaxID=1920175 RepID=UPI0026243185|nr:hypothetical protein [Polaribacter sp.]MDG1404085.1 hypothetical protein [Polaribacter sp.]
MDIIANIVQYFQTNNDKPQEASPEGTCAVCWGQQQYNGKIRDLFEDKQIDVNNHRDSYMMIQDFMKKNIDGVKLKEGVITDCPNCSVKKTN